MISKTRFALDQPEYPEEDAAPVPKCVVTDFRKRPYFFLSKAELQHLLDEIPNLKKKLQECNEKLEEDPDEDPFALFEEQRMVVPDTYSFRRRGVYTVGGKHSTYSINWHVTRDRKIMYVAKEKRKRANRMATQERLEREARASNYRIQKVKQDGNHFGCHLFKLFFLICCFFKFFQRGLRRSPESLKGKEADPVGYQENHWRSKFKRCNMPLLKKFDRLMNFNHFEDDK